MKKKLLAAALTLTLAVAALTGCGETNSNNSTGSNSDLKPLRIAVMTGQPDQYIAEIGVKEGIFEKYGIDLQATEYIYGINTIDAIVNGTADLGEMADYATVNRLGNTYGATDLVVFSELTGSSENVGGLYVAPEYADNLAALDGSKGFMSTTGTVIDYYVAKSIEWLGFDYDKQNIIAIDSTQTGLALAKSGEASAYVVSGANTKYFEEIGWKLVASFDDIGLETGSYMLANRSFVDANSELIANYLKAFEEVKVYIDNNLDDSATYLAGKLGIVEEDFKTSWKNLNIKPGLSKEAVDHLNDIREWAYNAGRFEAQYDIVEFFDADAAKIAFPERVTFE